jgi:hypothetical protein
MIRYFSRLNQHIVIEGFFDQPFGIELLFFPQLLAQITFSCLVSGDDMNDNFPAVIFLANDGQCGKIVQKVGHELGGIESESKKRMLWRIPKGVILLSLFRDNASIVIGLEHIFDEVIPIL